jgi:hypothetical protein
MKLPSKRTRDARRRLRFAVPGLLVFAAGCASTPPIPTTNLQAAQQAIGDATTVDAGKFASAELDEARAKMSAAQRAVDEKKMILGAQLADEARAEADLARARTAAAKANAVNEEMRQSNATLIEEMQRKTGDSR